MWRSPKKFEHLQQLHQQNLPFPDIVVDQVNDSPRRTVRSPSRFDHLQHLHQSNLNFPDLVESDDDDNLSVISVASSRCLEQLQQLHYQSLQFPDLLDDDDKWSTASSRCLDQLSMLHYRDRYCGLNTIQFLDVRRDDTREFLSIFTNLSSCSEMGSPESKDPNSNLTFSASPTKVLKSDLKDIEECQSRSPSPEKLKDIVEDIHSEESSPEVGATAAPKPRRSRSLYKVFVKNLSFNAKIKELKDAFSKFGDVVNCHIVVDHYTKKSRGFAFITFKQAEDAKKAVEYAATGNLIVNERVLSVVLAVPRKRTLTSDTSEQSDTEAEDHTLILDDMSLVLIFSYLNIKDRCIVERVCHRWKNLAQQSWSSITYLDFRHVFSLFLNRILTDYVLKCILHKGCNSLKKLDFSSVSHRLSPHALNVIGKYAPTVEILNLTQVPITKSKFIKFCERCNIKSFTMVGSSELGEKSLWTLLHRCKELQELNISENLRIHGTSFIQLNPCCTAVNLNSCSKILDDSIEKLCQRCPNLKRLYLNECSNLSNNALSVIGQNLKKIEYFSLEGYFPKCSSQGLGFIENFEKLVELNLARNLLVDDNMLLIISTRCRLLEKLDISTCYSYVSDIGIDHLALLKHLTILYMNYLNKVSDRSVQSVAENGYLEDFRARGCPQLSDIIMVSLAQNCLRIERVDVCGCLNVTNRGVLAFYETSSLRPSRHKVTLVFGETLIKNDLLPKDLRDHGIITDTISSCLGHFNSDGSFYSGMIFDDELSDSSESEANAGQDEALAEQKFMMFPGGYEDVEDFLTADDAFDEYDGELT